MALCSNGKGPKQFRGLREYMLSAVARLAAENQEVKLFLDQLGNERPAEPKD
jgi:hypothetical protein